MIEKELGMELINDVVALVSTVGAAILKDSVQQTVKSSYE